MGETQENNKLHASTKPDAAMKEYGLTIEVPETSTDGEVPPAFKSPAQASDADGFGRMKAPPVCNNETLKKESMSTEELSKLCFPQCDTTVSTVMSTASGCSISSRESDHQSQLNAKVMTQKISRQGRETQRWMTDPSSFRRIRLVTGCVPILKGGLILFVSSSRKPEWILPKGGWELDESMEESAVRETYEEAGVLGTRGATLSEIQYETRKSKKRRLELEEMLKRLKNASPEAGSSSGGSDDVPSEEEQSAPDKEQTTPTFVPPPPVTVIHTGDSDKDEAKTPDGTMSDDVVNRIRASRNLGGNGCDETSSAASDASGTYSLVRMTLFPLYVTEVKDDWPECGRFRKAVEIDDAIEMMRSRPEFQAVLKEVKQKNIHLMTPQENIQ
jgi:diphosphoinositol-polyphosphate diphosphatase